MSTEIGEVTTKFEMALKTLKTSAGWAEKFNWPHMATGPLVAQMWSRTL